MDLLSKQKFYVWVIGILVVLNLVTILFLWIGRPKPLPPPPPQQHPQALNRNMGDFLTQELQLTSGQLKKFNEYRKEHFDTTSSISRQINKKQKAIMDEVFSNNPDKERVDKLAGEIGELNTRLQEFLFNHFMKLKSVLNQNQIKRFRRLVHDSMPPRERNIQPPPFERGHGKIPPPPERR